MQFSPSVRHQNPATGFWPPSATVVSAEPFSHRTVTLRCLQKEKATYRHWSVFLWRDLDDVPHCWILSPDKTERRLISATLCSWHAYKKKKKCSTVNVHISCIISQIQLHSTHWSKLTNFSYLICIKCPEESATFTISPQRLVKNYNGVKKCSIKYLPILRQNMIVMNRWTDRQTEGQMKWKLHRLY